MINNEELKALKILTIEMAKEAFKQDYGDLSEEDDDYIEEKALLDSYCQGVEDVLKNLKNLEQEPVLDKIRAEMFEEKEHAYANFEAYKIDYLMQDEEDVLNSLPQDDFRYGLERAIEIIDKYRQRK